MHAQSRKALFLENSFLWFIFGNCIWIPEMDLKIEMSQADYWFSHVWTYADEHEDMAVLLG